jgi:single-stranded DNA-binding protein
VHLNKVLLMGRICARGVRVTYDERAIPTCAFTLEVDELGKDRVFTSYLPVEVVGKYAEAAAEALEPGDEVLVEGKLKYKNFPDAKGQKTSKLLVSTWQVTKAPAPVPTATEGQR